MNQKTETPKGKPKKPRYELTLAEFPIALLSKVPKGDLEVLEYRDVIEGKDGKPTERTWRVVPSKKYGFGGPTTIGTLFEIFQIWHEQGFQDRQIKFQSIYRLIDRKFLHSKGRKNYLTVVRDLKTMAHITFDAVNAFWDNEKRAYVSVYGFKLFDYVAIYTDKPNGQAALPFSYVQVSDLLWESVNKQSFFPVGIKRELFHSFKPLEQRLVLYLEKIFRSQHTHKRDLFKLAEQLPIQSKAKFKIKQVLKQATEGLIRKGYDKINGYKFEKSADGRSENVVFYRTGTLEFPFRSSLRKEKKEPVEAEDLVNQILEDMGDEESKGFYTLVAQRMPKETIYRVLSEIRLEARESGIRNKGAIFTVKIKRYAQEQGIDLGLKESGAPKVEKKEEGRGPATTREKVKEKDPVKDRFRTKDEAEIKVLEAFYQTLNKDAQAAVEAQAEERIPDFIKQRMREGRTKGEESYGVRRSLEAARREVLRERLKEEGRGVSPSKKGKKGQEIS